MGERDDLGGFNGPFLGSDALADDAVTEAQLRSPLFVRLFRNVFVPAGLPVDHRTRCLGVRLVAPPEAVITGASAATLRGVPLASSVDPVEVVLPEDVTFTAQRGIHIRRTSRGAVDAEPWLGMRLATPQRLVLDLLCDSKLHGPLPQAVGKLDAVLHTGLLTREQAAGYLEGRHDNGIVQARKAIELCDGRAESVEESKMRIRLARAGLALTPQVCVHDTLGRFLARADLGDEEAKVAVEYDGEYHNAPEQRARDADRLARMRAAGWTVVVVTKDSTYEGRNGVIEQVRAAMATQLSRESSMPELWRRSAS